MDLFAEGGRKSFLPNVLSSRGRRPERQFLAYLSVGWCLGIFFAKFRRKSAGGKVAHGFVCKGVGEQAFYQMPCPPEAEGHGQIPCLSLCLSACGLVSRRFSSERFLSTCLCGCPVLSKPRAKDKCLVYLSVGWCPGICFAKFRRKSAGGKVAHGFVCRGWTKKLSTKCSVLQRPKA